MPQYADWTTRANTVAVVNTTTETIPAGGIVATVGDPDEHGRKRVGKPTSNGQLGCYIVGPQPILPADSEDGEPVGWATFDCPALGAYDPADGAPAIGEVWGPGVGSWLLQRGRAGFLIDGPHDELDGRVVVLRIGGEVDDYDTYYNGSYDDGTGGTSWSHDAIISLGCNEDVESATVGEIVYDKVRYTVTLIMRNRRPFASISMEVLEEDTIAVPTECKEVLTDVDVSVDVECVDGIITATPTVTKTTELIRVIACGECV